MNHLQIPTKSKREVIDITDQLSGLLPAGNGVLLVFMQHTTAAITTADLDPGTDLDLLDFLQAIVPHVNWRHMHDPEHTPDHMLASLIGPDVAVPYADGRLLLGTWQRVILLEFDGARQRQIVVQAITA